MFRRNSGSSAAAKGRTQTYFELLERLQAVKQRPDKATCPVCQLTLDGVKRYLHQLSYENVNNPDERDRLRETGGFCNWHTWQWYELKDALGTAILYNDLSGLLFKRLEENITGNPEANKGLFSSLFGNAGQNTPVPARDARENLGFATCRACSVQIETEQRVVDDFVAGLSHEAFRAAYSESYGVCLPHIMKAQKNLGASDRDWLVKAEKDIWDRMQQELAEVVDKFNFDHRRGKQEMGAEIQSVRRALWKTTGMPGIT